MSLNRDMEVVVREHTDPVTAEHIWERLNQERAPDDLLATAPAFGAWASCDPDARPLPLWVAYRGGAPVALLAARRGSRVVKGVRLGVLETAGNDHWRAGGPIVGRDAEASVAALLTGLRGQRGWDVMELGPMLDGSDTPALLVREGRRLGFRPEVLPQKDEPVVKLGGAWEDYYMTLSGNLRSQVRRGEARLRREGPLRLEEHTGGPDLDARLDELFGVEASGWKGREGTAIASDASVRGFYTRLAHDAARRGWLRLYLLRAGDRCIAADYCIAHERTVYMLKVGYDERLSICSPGHVMRKHVLERLFAAGRDDIYDMMGGGGEHRAYKMRWANLLRGRVMVRLYHPGSVLGQLAAGASRLRAWFKDWTGAASSTPASGDA
ncbi:MAG: GNAT family N-acetyltransferase [Polyangiaceae bacterium]|nr:GNAT family N-acetyltransferase [Polyangiaceae bacterium]